MNDLLEIQKLVKNKIESHSKDSKSNAQVEINFRVMFESATVMFEMRLTKGDFCCPVKVLIPAQLIMYAPDKNKLIDHISGLLIESDRAFNKRFENSTTTMTLKK